MWRNEKLQFELVPPYKISPGQQTAVDELLKNYQTKDKQTLLGITGCGKSVISDTDVIIKKNGVPHKLKIGLLIDEIFSQDNIRVEVVNGTEVLDTSQLVDTYEACSLNPSTRKQEWKRVRQFIRHNSPQNLYSVKTKCGREIVVTGDHNFFALRDGNLTLTDSSNLTDHDFLPIPMEITGSSVSLESVSLDRYLPANLKLFASLPNFENALKNNPEKISSALPYSKRYRVLHSERVTYTQYQELVSIDPVSCQGAKFGLFHGNRDLPLHFPITDDFLRLLGYYIAEGHGEKGYFILSSTEEQIITDFQSTLQGLKIRSYKRPETCDYSCYSAFYSSLFKVWCGKDSGSKHLPDFWMQLSNKQLANLLMAYFSGDGCVNESTVSCTTKSRQLASDIAYSLLRFGIVSRTRKRMVRLPDKHQKLPYWEIVISGQKFLRKFCSNIGFRQSWKNNRLETIFSKPANTNVDLIPANGLIKSIRENLMLSEGALSALSGIRQSYVSLIESNERMPSREVTRKVVEAFRYYAKEKNAISIQEAIDNLESLLEVFWSPVSGVEEVSGEKYVYDISVDGNETFLAGTGGIFVHNTFIMANVINTLQKPTLILAHNKTLAAQLYGELKEMFPHNRVEFFISFYDYYQPESYLPAQDMYIEKDSLVNDEIEKMRMHAVSSVVSRNDTIIVASISCIYSLGNPDDFRTMAIRLEVGAHMSRQQLIHSLVDMQYERNDMVLEPGRFRVRGDTVDIVPSYENDILRVELTGNIISKIKEVHTITGDVKNSLDRLTLYPARQYVVPEEKHALALEHIQQELEARLPNLPPLEAQRLKQRTNYDLEMIKEVGFCAGMENYSRHFDGRRPGAPPFTLIDYFPKDYLLIIDESHQTIPQARGMYNGDYSRKKNLVDFGFRLPSALDNRPLKFEEFEGKMGRVLFASATPAEYELEKSGTPVELITRPTGLLDPEVEMHPIEGQMQHLMAEAKKTIERGDRVLVTTLTKRMAEDLADYLVKEGFRVRYMHSEIESLDRIELIRQLRVGEFDILVGINLLREGLDIPEVASIFILDADKEGFLRDERSLVQTIGRAARNVNGKVYLYADVQTQSIKRAMEITWYRRNFQKRYNEQHGITPKTIVKAVTIKESTIKGTKHLAQSDIQRQIIELDAKMHEAAEKLEFEKAIELRDAIAELQRTLAQKMEKEAVQPEI